MASRGNGVPVPRPFVKWAGGKGSLAEIYDSLGFFNVEFRDYYEPFLGGGAMFFYLWRKGKIGRIAHLSDINRDLIDAYQIIKEDVPSLISELENLKDDYSSETYYQRREEYNTLKGKEKLTNEEKIRKSALFIYLNKTCFNGLYRENRRGMFNVPYGRYKNPKILDVENLNAVSIALQMAEIQATDFENAVSRAEEGDFVYFDPPYMPISPTASFTSYHQNDFDLEEQKRLAGVVADLNRRGVYVLLSNAYHPQIKELYENIPEIHFFEVRAPRFINSNGNGRGPIKEYAITNYPIKQKQKELFIFS